MTLPVLPTGLRPIISEYSFQGPGGVVRTEVGGGMPRSAMQWDRGVQPFQVTLPLTPLEMSVWSTFFHHSIRKGALAFRMPLDSGFGTSLHTVSMVPGTYSAARRGVNTWASFVVEAESQAYGMTAAEAEELLAFYEVYGPASAALLERLAKFANEDTLVLQS